MTKYKVTITHTQGEEYEVEAPNEDEALDLVYRGSVDPIRSKDISSEVVDIEEMGDAL